MICKKQSYQFQVIIFLIILYISFSYSNSDTTFSNTRLIFKGNRSNPSEEVENHENRSELKNRHNGDDEDCNLFGNFFEFIFIEPFKAFFTNKGSLDNFAEKPFKLGLGASLLDFSFYPSTSLSYGFNFFGDLIYVVNDHIAFREHLGIHLSPVGGYFSDFERDAFVNSIKIGQQKDVGDGYANFSFPFYSEILMRPSGPDGSIFFTIGGGPRYVFEEFKGIRSYTYQAKIDTITIKNGDWIPSLSFGVGKIVDLGGGFASFEIRYSLGLNNNRKKLSLPGDNTQVVNGFTLIQFGLLF